MQIAEPALAALGHPRPRLVTVEVGDCFPGFCVGDHRSNRHAQRDVGGTASVLVGSAPVFAGLRAVDARVTVVDQRIDVAIRDRPDTSAASAVAAVGAAARHVFLAAERHGAIAAVTAGDVDVRFVDKFHDPSFA